MCVTEREKFIIPVRAIGARALLDFPDEVNFSSAPVKVWSSLLTVSILVLCLHAHACLCVTLLPPPPHFQCHSTKTVLVRNVGNREAKFNMATKRSVVINNKPHVSDNYMYSYTYIQSFHSEPIICYSG